jgi:hypothetical protein
MFNFYYASLDANSVCEAVNSYETQITPPDNYVPVNSDDDSIIGKFWNGTTFEEVVE